MEFAVIERVRNDGEERESGRLREREITQIRGGYVWQYVLYNLAEVWSDNVALFMHPLETTLFFYTVSVQSSSTRFSSTIFIWQYYFSLIQLCLKKFNSLEFEHTSSVLRYIKHLSELKFEGSTPELATVEG